MNESDRIIIGSSFMLATVIILFIFYIRGRIKLYKIEQAELARKLELEAKKKRQEEENKITEIKRKEKIAELEKIKPQIEELEALNEQMYRWFNARIYIQLKYIIAEINLKETFQNSYEEMFYNLIKEIIKKREFRSSLYEYYSRDTGEILREAKKIVKLNENNRSFILNQFEGVYREVHEQSFFVMETLLKELSNRDLYKDILIPIRKRNLVVDWWNIRKNNYNDDNPLPEAALSLIGQSEEIKNSNYLYFLSNKTYYYFKDYDNCERLRMEEKWRKEHEIREKKEYDKKKTYLETKSKYDRIFRVPFFESHINFQIVLNESYESNIKIKIPNVFRGKNEFQNFCALNNLNFTYLITREIDVYTTLRMDRIKEKALCKNIYINLLSINFCEKYGLEYLYFLRENSSENIYFKLKNSPIEYSFENFDFNNIQNKLLCFNVSRCFKRVAKNRNSIPKNSPHEFSFNKLKSGFLLLVDLKRITSFVLDDPEWAIQLNKGEVIKIDFNMPLVANSEIEDYMKEISQNF